MSRNSSNVDHVYINAEVGSRQIIPDTISINATTFEKKQGPYEKFRFPKIDPPLSEAGKLEIPKIQSLQYVVNLACGKLEPELKEIWDRVAPRDVSCPEISKSGMQLKNQCSKYTRMELGDLGTLASLFSSQTSLSNFHVLLLAHLG